MCISVDLPEPDGPMMATNSFSSMRTETSRSAATSNVAGRVDLAHVDQLDDRGRLGGARDGGRGHRLNPPGSSRRPADHPGSWSPPAGGEQPFAAAGRG